jgi:hypothetical protein
VAAVLTRAALAALATGLLATGCSGSHPRSATHLHLRTPFVPAGHKLLRECRSAARAVGYAVPCPTLTPRGLVGTQTGIPTRPYGTRRPQPGCRPRFAIVGVGPCRPLGKWTGWIASSSEVPNPYRAFSPREHLIISTSPRPIRDYARFVNGPGWYPGDRVDVGGWISVNGWRARWVFVPPQTNDGSAEAGHVMLIWTTGGHTYGVGFHDTSTRAATRAMDLQFVRHLRMVAS